MKKISCGIVFLSIFFSVNSFATSDCSPQVENDKVLVELFNADGQVVYSQKHELSPIIYWTDIVWTDEATLKSLEHSSGSNRVIFGKKKKVRKLFRKVGKSRTVRQENGTPIATIGGCPQQKVKLAYFKKKYSEKPFVGKSFIQVSASVQAQAAKQKNTTLATPASIPKKVSGSKVETAAIKKTNSLISKPNPKSLLSNVINDVNMNVLGMPLGEKFDEKSVSKVLKRYGRNSFTISVLPKNRDHDFNSFELGTEKFANNIIHRIVISSDSNYCREKKKVECINKMRSLLNGLVEINGEPVQLNDTLNLKTEKPMLEAEFKFSRYNKSQSRNKQYHIIFHASFYKGNSQVDLTYHDKTAEKESSDAYWKGVYSKENLPNMKILYVNTDDITQKPASMKDLKIFSKETKDLKRFKSNLTCYSYKHSPKLGGISIGDHKDKVMNQKKIPSFLPKTSKWKYSNTTAYGKRLVLRSGDRAKGSLIVSLTENDLVKEVLLGLKCKSCNNSDYLRDNLISKFGKADKGGQSGRNSVYTWFATKERGYGFLFLSQKMNVGLSRDFKLNAYCVSERIQKANSVKTNIDRKSVNKKYSKVDTYFSSSVPTAKDGENYLGFKIFSESKGRIGLTSFNKINGLKQIQSGVNYYTMEFTSIIQFLENCQWVTGQLGEFKGFETKPVFTKSGGTAGFMANFHNPGTNVNKGLKAKLSGEIFFQKTENGWRVLRMTVKKREKLG